MRTNCFDGTLSCALLAFLAATTTTPSTAQAPPPAAAVPAAPFPITPPSLPPLQIVDLMTLPGSATFGAQWRTMEAKIVDTAPIEAALPGYKTAYDIQPHAGESGYDDSSWPKIEATELSVRRGGGHVSFIWYRTNLTIPAKIGNFETAGKKAVLTVLIDDYAEVWINGQVPRRVGYPSPATIQGFNMPNRVVLTESVKPGETFQIALFGVNGPISVSPANTVWFRGAQMEFYP